MAIESQIGARSKAYDRERRGEVPIDTEAYAALAGISVDEHEARRLDRLVKDVARRIGLDHDVGFRTSTKLAGRYFEYCFLGTFHGWDRPRQPILVGVGMKASVVEDIALLYRYKGFGGGLPPGLEPMLEDFLKLSETERVEAVLVHERLELEAAGRGSANPHRAAIQDAPRTKYVISPRARRHLELYARLDRGLPLP